MFTRDSMTGKHALVCGASKGIGQACAIELARAGARVTVLARSQANLDATMKSLKESGHGHRPVVCDVSDLNQVRAALPEIGRDVDILVCNSGGPSPGPLLNAETSALEEAFSQHVLANLILVQAFVPHMQTQRFGRIINIISTSVKIPLPGLGVSNTVRGAVASWAKTLANELGPHGITVNNILPGYTRTQRLEQILTNAMQKTGKSREDVEQGFLKDVPAGRFAEAQELAHACLFLASKEASYINGINLPVDGGRTGCL
ncbi:MAG TPA: SDR family oxidoreductase [Oligoflexus sp.]|uniref:SDR family oxidoreductase n=1 Tax=Oligoflexus sp. TaxID=1971216 RepID=UPI002D7F5429|nr:SDR family oxidoreductase [Oligoflexus sp.]HET9239620.1 SDR family oxidoreductase [Oligoflexus sp.]